MNYALRRVAGPGARCCSPRCRRRRPRPPRARCATTPATTITVELRRRAASCRWLRAPPRCCTPRVPVTAWSAPSRTARNPPKRPSVPVVGDAETLDFEQLLTLRPTVVVVAVDVVQRVRIDRIRALGHPGLPGARHAARGDARIAAAARVQLAGTQPTARREADALERRARSAGRALSRRARRCACSTRSGTGLSTRSAGATSSPTRCSCAARSTYSPDLETAAPAVTREAARAARSRADPRLGTAGRGRRMAGRVAAISGDDGGARTGSCVSYVDERMDRMGPSVIEATANLCAGHRPGAPGAGAASATRDIRNCRRLYRDACCGYLACPRGRRNLFQSGQVIKLAECHGRGRVRNEVDFVEPCQRRLR